MNNIDFQVNRDVIAVYCLWINEERVYIGKTNSLKTRLHQHRGDASASKDIWKNEVNKISYFNCNNTTDSDILETYLINYYSPKYNLDKQFGSKSTLYIQLPEETYVNTTVRKRGNFEKLAKQLFLGEIDISEIPETQIELIDAYYKLGVHRFKALDFQIGDIKRDLFIINNKEYIRKEVFKYFTLNTFYTDNTIKKQLNLVFKTLNLKRKITAKHILNYYGCKRKRKTMNGVTKHGFLLLSYIEA